MVRPHEPVAIAQSSLQIYLSVRICLSIVDIQTIKGLSFDECTRGFLLGFLEYLKKEGYVALTRIWCHWFRSIKIGHVKIFRNGLTVMVGFSNGFRDSFPLLVIELSDRMDLVHCKHTPFLLECCPQRHFKDT